jgi:hypothetical protein
VCLRGVCVCLSAHKQTRCVGGLPSPPTADVCSFSFYCVYRSGRCEDAGWCADFLSFFFALFVMCGCGDFPHHEVGVSCVQCKLFFAAAVFAFLLCIHIYVCNLRSAFYC